MGVIKTISPVKPAKVDYERNQVTIGLTDHTPRALFVSKGEPALMKFPDYGEVTIKLHEGRISHIWVKESHEFKALVIK